MNQIVLLANDSAPIDKRALLNGLGQPADLVQAPGFCLTKPLKQDAERVLCSLVESANAFVFRVGQVTESLINAARHLRIVAVHGIGTDSVDIAAASKNGVYVTVTPGTNSQAVAEFVIGYLLLACRQIHESIGLLKKGQWDSARIEGTELHDKSVGIVGYGSVGSQVAHLAGCFGMKVMISAHTSVSQCSYPVLPLTQLVSMVDFLVIAVPRRRTTEHLVSEMILRKMKSSAFLINVARGGVVDEEALMTALDDGLIAGAYVDVFSQEPVHSDSRLIKHPFMYPTPHIAGSTKESLERTAYLAGQSIRQAWDGQRPVHSINTLLRS